MQITEEEFNAINETFTLLQQITVRGSDNIFLMSGSFSRLQGIINNVNERKQKEELEKYNKQEVK